jgi:hypothetical protein
LRDEGRERHCQEQSGVTVLEFLKFLFSFKTPFQKGGRSALKVNASKEEFKIVSPKSPLK